MTLQKKQDGQTVHSCVSCGSCCSSFCFIQLTQRDVDRLEAYTKTPQVHFSNSHRCGDKVAFMKFNENGDCIFLTKKDGMCSCGVYEARSEICRTYPKDDTQIQRCFLSSNRTSE